MFLLRNIYKTLFIIIIFYFDNCMLSVNGITTEVTTKQPNPTSTTIRSLSSTSDLIHSIDDIQKKFNKKHIENRIININENEIDKPSSVSIPLPAIKSINTDNKNIEDQSVSNDLNPIESNRQNKMLTYYNYYPIIPPTLLPHPFSTSFYPQLQYYNQFTNFNAYQNDANNQLIDNHQINDSDNDNDYKEDDDDIDDDDQNDIDSEDNNVNDEINNIDIDDVHDIMARANKRRRPGSSSKKNSKIFYIRLPPQPYTFDGLGYISQPPSIQPLIQQVPIVRPVLPPPSPPSPPQQIPYQNPFINVPITFLANGKPTHVYQYPWNGYPNPNTLAVSNPYGNNFGVTNGFIPPHNNYGQQNVFATSTPFGQNAYVQNTFGQNPFGQHIYNQQTFGQGGFTNPFNNFVPQFPNYIQSPKPLQQNQNQKPYRPYRPFNKPKPYLQDSKITHLKGPYVFNGKPEDIYVLQQNSPMNTPSYPIPYHNNPFNTQFNNPFNTMYSNQLQNYY